MAPPRKRAATVATSQASIRVDASVAERSELVIAALLKVQPQLRPFLISLPAAYRLFLERGLHAYEAELGLAGGDTVPRKAKPAAKRRAPK